MDMLPLASRSAGAEKTFNSDGGAMAAGAGFLVDGVLFHAFLSNLLETPREMIGGTRGCRSSAEPSAPSAAPTTRASSRARSATRCNATYDVIDAYRSLFLVKHPSRGAMLAETKRVVASPSAKSGRMRRSTSASSADSRGEGS